jgi:hypothetical protein
MKNLRTFSCFLLLVKENCRQTLLNSLLLHIKGHSELKKSKDIKFVKDLVANKKSSY